MRPNLFLHSYKIYRLKYMIPKFEMSRIKIGEFTSAESWAVLPRKMAFKSRQPRPEGLLAFQNGGGSGEDPGTQQNHVTKISNEDGNVFKMAAKAK